MELHTVFYKILLSWKCIFPLLLYLGIGLHVRAEMNVHVFMNELDQKDYWYPREKRMKIYVQSQWRVVLLWYHIFWQSSTQRERHTQLCIITSLIPLIQICSNFQLLGLHPLNFYSVNPHWYLPMNFPVNTDDNTDLNILERRNKYPPRPLPRCIRWVHRCSNLHVFICTILLLLIGLNKVHVLSMICMFPKHSPSSEFSVLFKRLISLSDTLNLY